MNYNRLLALALAFSGPAVAPGQDAGTSTSDPAASRSGSAAHALAVPAFPGAEGFGANASGGRGGRVIAVTNLNDDGPGSLRTALHEKGPRTIVFSVSGTIALKSTLRLRDGNVTIAGQTAPGDGICLKNYPLDFSGARNVIIRYLRVRPGDSAGHELDALTGRGCEDVIVDHCSVSWSVDEALSVYQCRNFTVQWCLVSESLYQSVHEKGHHGFGGIWGGTNASWHHNLLAHHSSRNPRVAPDSINVDIRNNVIYNWGYNSTYGGERSRVNLVANYYKAGPATREGIRNRILDGSDEGGQWYLTGNFVAGFPPITADNWAGGVHKPWAQNEMRAATTFPAAPVTVQDAEAAYQLVLAHAGATLPKRDPVDARIVGEVRDGTATYSGTYGAGLGIIDLPATVGGWPELHSTPAPADTDHDGMPDDWERRFGFEPGDPSDGPQDMDSDGCTNLEEYLNGTGPAEFVDYRVRR
jgi:pectate lyase